MATHQWTVGSASDLRVIGQNSEMADMSNPSGDIIGEVSFLLVTDAQGYRLAGPIIGTNATPRQVQKAEELLRLAINVHGMNPAKHWAFQEYQPVYGSDAYVDSGAEMELIAWEREYDRRGW